MSIQRSYSAPYLSSLPAAASSSSASNVKEAYEQLDKQFNRLVRDAKRHPVSENNVQPDWIADLQKAARSPAWQETVGDFVMRKHPEDMQHLRDQYEKRTLLLENNAEKKEGQKSAKPAKNDYKQLNSSFADLEARVSNMTKGSKAVFVGSGPQPNTVLAYVNHADSVTGIDINPEAIEATKAIASASGGKIQFEQVPGEAFNYKPYTHVGIAVMVPDKGKILEQIRKTSGPDCTVIVRSVDGLKNAMYEGFDPAASKGFEKIATLHGTDHNITHATILRKKPLNIVA
ncbi:nicotianamine synthase family protein [Vampirovibrio sp.]|uniref:nicotianamine synthase family protein n=1 Tax=Vampirovibrio sp. TaxID=2717857 RepID=UPI0035934F10